MTEPPYGDQRAPYPRQELSAQQVQPGRSRLPRVVAAVVVLLAVVGALVGWRLLHDDGEQSRAAYCAALRDVTRNGDLLSAFGSTGADVSTQLGRVRELAPGVVKSQWDDLMSVLQSVPTTQPDLGQVASAFTDLTAIVDDAKANCGLTIEIPG